MSKTVKPENAKAVDGEHIFPAAYLHPLALRWKELNSTGKHAEAMKVLEEIVVASTDMFVRLAQHEGYHYTVDINILVSAAQEKVVKWLLKWQPKKGKLFSWFSKCSKNAFRSELVKVNQFRKRYHVTSDNLEKFFGVDDHEVDRHDAAHEVRAKLESLTCRWGDPQEIGAIHFLLECIVEEDHDKQNSIRAAAYAWGISFELSKFFYSWAIVAMRDVMYEKIRIPFTEQDLFRLQHSYSDILNLLDLPGTPFTWEQVKWLIATHGGKRIKIPTIAQLAKLREDKEIFDEIDESDKDPDSVALVAKKHSKTQRTAQETYYDMVNTLDPRRSGEHEIYGDSSTH